MALHTKFWRQSINHSELGMAISQMPIPKLSLNLSNGRVPIPQTKEWVNRNLQRIKNKFITRPDDSQ